MKKIEIEIKDETECILNAKLSELSQRYTKERAYGMLVDDIVECCGSGRLLYIPPHSICSLGWGVGK